MNRQAARAMVLALLALWVALPALASPPTGTETRFDHLFDTSSRAYDSLDDLPYWLPVLARHRQQDTPQQPVLSEWFELLDALRPLPRREQVRQVNEFMNRKPYVLDAVNYGQADYWAIVREFLALAGDCEDYSLSKFFSLRALGLPSRDLRLVILQDTNLGIPHAVLAVALDNDILILDNQTNHILTDRQIRHYRPLYSVNEEHWWLHMPELP